MSLTGSPSSPQAAGFRIIGATTSRPRSSACTGPTVVASSPVPSHALEITPVRTQRFSSMSCSRARSRPRYSWSLASGVRAETIEARWGGFSIVARNALTSFGSGFQSTYSGGSNAGNRFTSRKLFLELAEESAPSAAPRRRGGAGQRFRELDRGRKAVVWIRLQCFGEGSFDRVRDVGAQAADRDGLAPQARDHHFLRVAALERQLAGEHLERHDAERVDVAARVQRFAADLLGAHELRCAENDAGRRELRCRPVGGAAS